MGNMYPDKELVDKILAGNEHAFTLLVKQYERLVFVIVHRVVGEEDNTKDVCQEVFVKIYLNISKFSFQSKLSTWIATIAYREALNYLKKDKSKLMEDEALVETGDNSSLSEDAQQQLEKLELKEQIHRLIDKLPHQYKTVLTLYHLNEFNYKEIYEITGWPEGTVKNYLFRARKLLKDSLKKKVRDFDPSMV